MTDKAEDDRLYCLHVLGADDVHPAPDRKTAQEWATNFTVLWHLRHPNPHPYDPIMSFVVDEWPWDAESHAAGLAQSIAENTFPCPPYTPTEPTQ